MKTARELPITTRGRSAALLLALLGAGLASIARGQVVTEFPITFGSQANKIAAGPDGNLWFTGNDLIGRITTAGVVTEFLLTAASFPDGIAAGPDGNLWFTEGSNKIGRITTTGVVTEFGIPTGGQTSPVDITAGPDGNLWFVEAVGNQIGRITTAGVISEFPIPTASSFPQGIAAGPDGNLWFTETYTANQIGRITTAGVITEFPVPTTTGAGGIAAGPDGNLWFTAGGKIGRITATGVITEFPLPTGLGAVGIAAGPDGNLWFTGSSNILTFLIGRITTAGVVTEFYSPTFRAFEIAAGPDGNLWSTELYADKIGRITTAPTTPQLMDVDANGNGVLEPGETVQVAPSWKNTLADPQTLSATASNLTGPPGPTYTLNDSTADYGTIAAGATGDCNGATGDCYLMTISGARPADHWDATFQEDLSSNAIAKVWRLHVGESFLDVPRTNQFYAFIENLLHNGVTYGCGAGNYCPTSPVTRAQMAAFLLRAKFGASHVPLPATGTVFNDVPIDYPFAGWIEELARFQITGGCGGGDYCPDNPVTRAQMAVFLLKAEHGSAYTPPACTGVFGDVTCSNPFADWIEQLAAEGITGGCGNGDYCPDNPVTRGQMAVFLVKTFGLRLYGAAAPHLGYTVRIEIVGPGPLYHYEYLPSTIHIHVGDTIIWVLGGAHSSTGPGWNSGLGPLSFAHTFTQAGSFTYFCTAQHLGHPHYPGVVVVDP